MSRQWNVYHGFKHFQVSAQKVSESVMQTDRYHDLLGQTAVGRMHMLLF